MKNRILNRPLTVLGMLKQHLWQLVRALFSKARLYSEHMSLTESTDKRRSLFIRHLDCGSCNGCELELNALSNPVYDIERFGIRFEASPRHADLIVTTGPFTRNLEEAARLTFEAMPEPRLIVTIGDCAKDGGIFKESYAVTKRPEEIEQAIRATGIHVPGCPPTPSEILKALVEMKTK